MMPAAAAAHCLTAQVVMVFMSSTAISAAAVDH
jgi:hypothetical protein